jgi:hypothetical protein
MSGINSGILHNAYPLSSEQIKELEKEVLENQDAFAYLDENSELCFSMPNGVEALKDLAWNNAYELSTENGSLVKKAYIKTGLDSYELKKTFSKPSFDDIWSDNTIAEPTYTIISEVYNSSKLEHVGYTENRVRYLHENSFIEIQFNNVNILVDTRIFGEPGSTTIKTGPFVVGRLEDDTDVSVKLSINRQTNLYTATITSSETPVYMCYQVRDALVAGDFKYIINKDATATITEYVGESLDVVIPRVIENKTVISIGDLAFRNYTNLTSITIPDSITSIGNYAFYACTNLENVTIPDSVTSMGDCAFYECTNLENITIGNSVTNLGKYIFQMCTSLTNIIIPDSVISIGLGAFYKCDNLANVTIGKGVTSIGEGVFSGCNNLESIVFNGTTAQWNALIENDVWIGDVPATYIQCSDGCIDL